MIVTTQIVPRYAETDQMGVVHHSVYPIWFEVGRHDWMQQFGMWYSDFEEKGFMLPLSALQCAYHSPSHFEESLSLSTTVAFLSVSRITFSYEVKRQDTLLVTGETTHGFVDKTTFRPVNIKKKMPDFYQNLEREMKQ